MTCVRLFYWKCIKIFQLLLLLLWIGSPFLSKGQAFPLVDTADFAIEQQLIKSYSNKAESFLEQRKDKYKRKVFLSFKEEYEEYSESFVEKIAENEFLFDKRLNAFVDDIYHKLASKETDSKDVEILISKQRTLNAFMSPDNMLVFHMGCFYYTQNEGQLASIMAHELAHNILNHSEDSWIERISMSKSKESSRELSKIKRQKYSQRNSLVDLYKGRLYDESKQSRKYEYEADSLGYLLLKEAGYNSVDYISMLELSLDYDTLRPQGLELNIYEKYFDLPSQPFKQEWLKQESFSEYKYKAKSVAGIDKDSIATHPKLVDRIERLYAIYPELKDREQKPSESTDNYKAIQALAKYEFLPNLYDLEQHGVGVYIALQMLENGDTAADYCYFWLGQFFQKIAEARKEYNLSKYLSIVVPDKQSESYIQFLSFMWNLSLEELEYISTYYKEKSSAYAVIFTH